jgi:hypothetical protein
MTRTTRHRVMILQSPHIFFTDVLTFIASTPIFYSVALVTHYERLRGVAARSVLFASYRDTIRPLVKS